MASKAVRARGDDSINGGEHPSSIQGVNIYPMAGDLGGGGKGSCRLKYPRTRVRCDSREAWYSKFVRFVILRLIILLNFFFLLFLRTTRAHDYLDCRNQLEYRRFQLAYSSRFFNSAHKAIINKRASRSLHIDPFRTILGGLALPYYFFFFSARIDRPV